MGENLFSVTGNVTVTAGRTTVITNVGENPFSVAGNVTVTDVAKSYARSIHTDSAPLRHISKSVRRPGSTYDKNQPFLAVRMP